jgi:hypothetical protein
MSALRLEVAQAAGHSAQKANFKHFSFILKTNRAFCPSLVFKLPRGA